LNLNKIKIYINIKLLVSILSIILSFAIQAKTSPTITLWKDLSSVINCTDNKESLSNILNRDAATTAAYANLIQKLHDNNKSVANYIYEHIFGMSEQKSLQCSLKTCPNNNVLIINEFPYNFENDIIHLLFFSTDADWNKEHLKKKAEELMHKKLQVYLQNKNTEYLIHINPPNLRSVPEISHAHIFLYNPVIPDFKEKITKEFLLN